MLQVDRFRGSSERNESFHALVAKSADKRMPFPGSTESLFALTVASHSGVSRWRRPPRDSLSVPTRRLAYVS
jgi:hypothetical protein